MDYSEMKMPGRKTQWTDQDKGMRQFRKKQQLREEEKEWRAEVEYPTCVQADECLYPECACLD